jgi:dihydrofolate reductase
MKTQYYTATSLDGFIATEDDSLASVTLGKGRQLFPRRVTSPPWKLLSVRQIGSGLAELRYQLPRSRAP